MAEPQPWRNPRPAPQLAEIRNRIRAPRAWIWLRAWWPALLWSGVIFSMSTDTFSDAHTARVFEPILRWMIPSLSAHQFEVIHNFIRKCAHFAEYFIFFLLLYRAVRGTRKGWRWSWGTAAFLGVAAYSLLDEFHQLFVPSRGSSIYDSLLDSIAAGVAFVALWLWSRSRANVSSTIASSTDPIP